MTYDSWDSTPDIGEDISILLATACPFVLYTCVFVFGILPFCTVLYLTTHQHNASIRGFEYYQYAQIHLLVILFFTDLASINVLAMCISKRVPFMLPIIAADVCLVPRQQETDWEEGGSQATTLFCDDWYDEQIDHDGDTEPLLQEWLAEQQRLNQIEDDDASENAELTISESSTVNPEMDIWFINGDSGYGSEDSSLVAVADPFLLPAAISD
ncbi:hypothetical protein TGAM01_v208807 [Trichoderma gamsii]|uniref:Uncharacterized protein n=1 Tax=Trichoderma gamsii TaxID=398673 RepID=A0A2P4ZDH1_9HYPO|nr:hypothetical protein TGAM01_v208807 [Trichoderma gamsii]PON22324.1 hypothetical protein TGAM01_v208807 [Trichoderma gamsii]